MRDFPTDPMARHDRLIAAFCDDLASDALRDGKAPRAERVIEIARQIDERKDER